MGINFNNQKEAMDYTRGILLENEFEKLTPMDDDFQFLDELLDRHPTRKEDIGEVEFFRVIRNPLGHHLALNVCDEKGEREMSWVDCVKGKTKKKKDKLTTAMRSAVLDQTQGFKNRECNCQSWQCMNCGKIITNRRLAHVDHIIDFIKLKEIFLEDRNDIPTKFFEKGSHYPTEFDVMSSTFENEWKLFHKQNAHLQMLCSSCNLKKKKQKTSLQSVNS